MPRVPDLNAVVNPLAQDAPPEVIRRQQLDTALLVGQVVSNLREAVHARLEIEANEPRVVKPRFDEAELEKELNALNGRLEECRTNLAQTSKNQEGKMRFLQLGEKRAAALKAALERIQQRR